MIVYALLILTLLATPGVSRAQGLEGLGPPGGLNRVSPEAAKIETELLIHINREYRKEAPPLRVDETLRGFARAQAERVARGQANASELPKLIESRKLAPFGYYFQLIYGENAQQLYAAIKKDRELRQSLSGDFARVGVGGFLAPAEEPFFQVMLLLAKDMDPRAGQPGLSKAQTDPVMDAAANQMRANCYDLELQRNPNFGGQALFEIRIDPTGQVDSAELLKGVEPNRFDPCILAVVYGLRFPEPYGDKPVTLRHPVRFTPPQGGKILGLLTDGQVRSTFARAAPEFRKCYNDRLKQLMGKKLKGRIVLSLDISKQGNVENVDLVDDTTLDLPLQNCVTAIASRLRFPEPKYGGPTTVSFPLDFGL